jgi:RNA polymerase sigma factor (sigma-70 family)
MDSPRNNEKWTTELCGSDLQEQAQAFQDLGRYLFVLACQFLSDQRANLPYIANLAHSEIEELAQDCVQETLVKVWQAVCKNSRFKGEAKFTTYATSILLNEIKAWIRRHRRLTYLRSGLEERI